MRSSPGERSSSFARGLSVLAALLEHGPQRVDQIALHAGLPVSSTYRYIRDLTVAGFAMAELGVYRPGPRLASPVGDQESLREIGHAVLTELAHATGETAMLTVRVGTRGLVLDRVESAHAIRLSFQPGIMRPLHAGATVKVLLAYAPPEVVSEVIEAGLERFTAQTPDAARLLEQLAQIRAQGYAISHGEADPHAVGIGVPVFRGDRSLCGLSIAGPAARLTPAIVRRALETVQDASRHLTAALSAPAVLRPGA